MRLTRLLAIPYEYRVQNPSVGKVSRLGLILTSIFVVGFAVRVFKLDFYSLWYDEATTAYLLQGKSVGEALNTVVSTTGSETLHPLYYLILSLWMQLAGDSEPAMRFPSVVFGTCAVVVYAYLLYQLAGTKSLALSLLLIISPFSMWYSRDARPYALIMFLSGLHMLFYLHLLVRQQSKIHLVGFIITGILSIYSGIFVGMILMAELIWSLLRRRSRAVIAAALVILSASPLVWHGYRTFFVPTSERYYDLPKTKLDYTRILSVPQEFLVGRSLGPTPTEIRRLSVGQAIKAKSSELIVEAVSTLCILAAFITSLQLRKEIRRLYRSEEVRALAFIVGACILQMAVLVGVKGYIVNARHLCVIFVPLFVLVVLPIANSTKPLAKLLFALPVLVLWVWSSSNQIFDAAYQQEDYRRAVEIVNNDEHHATRVIALCHPYALQYYEIQKPSHYFREDPDLTCRAFTKHVFHKQGPAWIILARSWNYPSFRSEELTEYFQVLREEQLAGIDMWLLAPLNAQ